VGIRDVFGESGKPEELLEKYGLAPAQVVMAVKEVIQRKK
jgi:transketolase